MTSSSTTGFVPPSHCWRDIGVWGNLSCPKLELVVHCHNCEVYIQSGRHRLEQPSSENYRRQWTELLSHPKETEPAGTISVMIFRHGERWLALPTTVFREILEVRPVHAIPHRSNRVFLGLVTVQGELQLAFSLVDLMGLKTTPDSASGRHAFKRMVSIEREGERWVFTADEVHGLHKLAPADSVPLTAVVEDPGSTYLSAMFELDGRIVNLIDEGLLFAALKRSLQ